MDREGRLTSTSIATSQRYHQIILRYLSLSLLKAFFLEPEEPGGDS